MMLDNDVLSGVTAKLREIFPSSKIYIDERKQELNAPCFFARLITVTQQKLLQYRYYRTYSFDVEYHPTDEEVSAREINDVRSKLLIGLEHISVAGNLARGSAINTRTEDGVLHFFVDYGIFVIIEPDAEPKMMVLKQNQLVKKG